MPLKKVWQNLLMNCIVIPKAHDPISRLWQAIRAVFYGFRTGLKVSNFQINEINLTSEKIQAAIGDEAFDLVIYEYWHAWKSVEVFKDRQITSPFRYA